MSSKTLSKVSTPVCPRPQHGANFGSPAPNAAWLGVSPPTRTTGAANPLVQDFNWRSDAYRCAALPPHCADRPTVAHAWTPGP